MSQSQPPPRKAALVSRAYVRDALLAEVGGARVSPKTIQIIVDAILGFFSLILSATAAAHHAETEARQFHGLYPKVDVKPGHVRVPEIVKSTGPGAGVGIPVSGTQEVKNEEDAPEVA